jgi:hypothetical protein
MEVSLIGKGKISFEGASMIDPYGLLEGDASKTRTMRITSPETIWSIQADTASYPDWGPGKEIFSGLLLPIFGKNLPDLIENFEGFVIALKKQAEKGE